MESYSLLDTRKFRKTQLIVHEVGHRVPTKFSVWFTRSSHQTHFLWIISCKNHRLVTKIVIEGYEEDWTHPVQLFLYVPFLRKAFCPQLKYGRLSPVNLGHCPPSYRYLYTFIKFKNATLTRVILVFFF